MLSYLKLNRQKPLWWACSFLGLLLLLSVIDQTKYASLEARIREHTLFTLGLTCCFFALLFIRSFRSYTMKDSLYASGPFLALRIEGFTRELVDVHNHLLFIDQRLSGTSHRYPVKVEFYSRDVVVVVALAADDEALYSNESLRCGLRKFGAELCPAGIRKTVSLHELETHHDRYLPDLIHSLTAYLQEQQIQSSLSV